MDQIVDLGKKLGQNSKNIMEQTKEIANAASKVMENKEVQKYAETAKAMAKAKLAAKEEKKEDKKAADSKDKKSKKNAADTAEQASAFSTMLNLASSLGGKDKDSDSDDEKRDSKQSPMSPRAKA